MTYTGRIRCYRKEETSIEKNEKRIREKARVGQAGGTWGVEGSGRAWELYLERVGDFARLLNCPLTFLEIIQLNKQIIL